MPDTLWDDSDLFKTDNVSLTAKFDSVKKTMI